MVSKASELLPEPERPVTTVSVLRGMRTLMSRRLCCRAPRTEMCVIVIYGTGKLRREEQTRNCKGVRQPVALNSQGRHNQIFTTCETLSRYSSCQHRRGQRSAIQ